MKYILNYRVAVELCLSNDEFTILDAAVKNSEYKQEAVVGGFWYGQSGRREWCKKSTPDEDCFLSFEYRQLDKLTKCLEPYGWGYIESEVGKALYNKMYTMLKNVNECVGGLNRHSGVVEVTK